MEDAGRGGLGGRCSITLHETRVTGEGDKSARITFLQMDLEKTEGSAAVLEVEHQRGLGLRPV